MTLSLYIPWPVSVLVPNACDQTQPRLYTAPDLFQPLHHPTAWHGVGVDDVGPVADSVQTPFILQRYRVSNVGKLPVTK